MKSAIQILLALCLLGGFNTAAHAAEPSSQPAVLPDDPMKDPMTQVMPPSTTSNHNPDEGEDGHQRRTERERPRARLLQPYSVKETTDAMQFMQMHSPERYKFVANLPEGEKKTGIQNFATRAYQSWMRLSHDDWKLYAVVMKRVGLEDEIFGLVSQLRSSQAHNEPVEKQEAIHAQLREKVVSLVDVGLKERQIRLDNLTRTVKAEQEKLSADSSDTKALVEKRMQTILADDKLRGFRPGDVEESH